MRALAWILVVVTLTGCARPAGELVGLAGDVQVEAYSSEAPYRGLVREVRSATSIHVSMVYRLPDVSEYSAFAAYWVSAKGGVTRLGGFDIDNAHLGEGDGVVAVHAGPLHAEDPRLPSIGPAPAGGNVTVNDTDGWVVVLWGEVTDVSIDIMTDGQVGPSTEFEAHAIEAQDWQGTAGIMSPAANVHVDRRWTTENAWLFGYVKVYRPTRSQGEVVCTHPEGSTRVSLEGPTSTDRISFDDERWLFSLRGPLACQMDGRATTGAKAYLAYLVMPGGVLPALDARFLDEVAPDR